MTIAFVFLLLFGTLLFFSLRAACRNKKEKNRRQVLFVLQLIFQGVGFLSMLGTIYYMFFHCGLFANEKNMQGCIVGAGVGAWFFLILALVFFLVSLSISPFVRKKENA